MSAPAVPRPTSGGVPRSVKGLSLVSLLNDFASEMVYPLLPSFVTRTLGGGPLVLGLLDGAAELTSSCVKWVSGRLSDRPGRQRPLILMGYAIAVLVRPVISTTSSALQVVGLRIVDRIGKGIRTPPRDAMIAAVTPPASRGRAFGFHRGADHLGAVLGSLAAWVLLSRGADIRSAISWSIVPGIAAFLVLALVLRGSSRETLSAGAARNTSAEVTGERRLAAAPSFYRPVLSLTALTFFRLPEALLILRLQDRGVAVSAVPLVWAGLHVVRSASSYPGGWLSDNLGPRRVIAAGGLLFAMIAAVFGLPLTPALAVVLFLVLGLVAGLTESGERSIVAQLSPVRTGRGFGSYHAIVGAAALPSGLIFGEIYQAWSGQTALWSSAVAMTGAVLVWLLVAPNDKGSTHS
jgi:MFS family permease